MSTEYVVSGVTFPAKIAKAMPVIPALQSLGFFGTGFSNNNGNRVSTGPAFVTPNGAPTYSTNYATVGGTGFPYIDTQNPRTSGVVASGWTWLVTFRVPVSGLASIVIGDGSSSVAGVHIRAANSTMLLRVDPLDIIEITASTALSNWHTVALTMSAGGGTVNLFNLTDNQQNSAAQSVSAQITNSPHLGADGVNDELSNVGNTVDCAAAMVCFSPLSLSACQAIYASWQTIMEFRGIPSI